MELVFRFGAPLAGHDVDDSQIRVDVENPVIAGLSAETWRLNDSPIHHERVSEVEVWRTEPHAVLLGQTALAGRSVMEATRDLYTAILEQAADRHVHRFWNFVPRINDPYSPAGDPIDQYMAFCMGRALAYENLQSDAESSPAASAVGTPGDTLTVVCLAASVPVTPVENPLQVPAYRYPHRYGPKAPRFARGAVIGGERRQLLISGTAAIRASESQHADNVAAQATLAIDNLAEVTRAADTARPFSTVRVYVRRVGDWPLLKGVIAPRLLDADVNFSIVQAEICRPELLVEIEACTTSQPQE